MFDHFQDIENRQSDKEVWQTIKSRVRLIHITTNHVLKVISLFIIISIFDIFSSHSVSEGELLLSLFVRCPSLTPSISNYDSMLSPHDQKLIKSEL